MKTVKLKDISVNNRGYYGIGASAVDYDANKYTYLRITDIKDDSSLNKNDLMSVDDEKANQYLLQKNDIVFARTGASTGRNYFYDGEIENMVYAGFLIKFSLNSNLVNPRYIKYYCLSQKYNNWILSSITGSTRPNINEKQLADMPIELPERKYQDKVVKIIDSLTNSIKLNNEINNNLLKLSNIIYKNLVDKEPLKEVKLCEISTIKYGKDLPTKNILESGYPVYGGNGVIGFYNEKMYDESQILISCRGAASGKVLFTKPNSFVTNNSLVLECDRDYYYYLKEYSLENPYYSYTTGSAQPQITIENIKDILIKIPNKDRLFEFNYIMKLIEGRYFNNIYLNETLAQLRDTLLPKLMNEEIDLDDIEI